MNAHVLSPRKRAVGFAIVVSIIMLGAAALGPLGLVVSPASSSGGSHASATAIGSTASSTSQTFTVTVGGSNAAVGSSLHSNPPSIAPSSSASPGSSFLEPFAGAVLTINPTSGIVGSTTVLTGSSFMPSDQVQAAFNSVDLACIEGPVTVGLDGSFTCPITIPTTTAGSYSITATTTDNGTITATSSFTVDPSVSLSSYSGTVGSSDTLTADGLAADTSYYVCFDATSETQSTYCVSFGPTDSDGSFSGSITIPSMPGGLYYVEVWTTAPSGTFVVAASSQFTLDASLTTSPTSGIVGTPGVVATGTGFGSSVTISTFTLNGVSLSCTSGSLNTDSTGSFSCDFTVPPAPAGAETVDASDGTNSATTTFTVNAFLSLSPTSGDVGGTTGATGTGFAASQPITFTLDGAPATSSCGSDSVGDLSCTVTIPPVSSGARTMMASDGVNSASATYTVYLDPTVAVAPTGPLAYDVGQTAATLTATMTYFGPNSDPVEWYSSATSSCSASSTDTSTPGASFTPDISTPGTTYYCAVVSDSGVPGYTSPSNAVEVTVNPSLGIPGAPTVTTPIDQGQSETVTASISGVTGTGSGTITYDLQSSATVSGTYTDTGASCTPSGSAVTCTYAPTAGTYYYEVTATDQATTPVTTTSAPSSAVTVNTALVVPTPTPGSQTVDRGQTATVTGTAPTTGASPYSYQWLEEAPSASSYSDATDCVAPTTLTCSFVTTGSTTAGTYGFELEVTDSAATPSVADSSPLTVVVNTALGTASAPTVSTALIDQGQTPTAATDTLPNPLGGTGPLTYTWLVSYNSGTYAAATSIQCATPSGPATNGEVVNCIVGASVAVGTYSYDIQLADSATTPTSTTSLASGTVTVSTALATASAPTVSTGLIDRGQTPTAATDTLPGPLDGSGTVTYTWLVSFDSGSFVPATSTQCMTPSGTASDSEVVNCVVGVSVAVGTYTYEIELTDTASSPETTASGASGIVAVDTALAAATSPSVSTTAIDQGQTPTAATDTLPNPLGGSGAVTYTWLVSFNSGTYTMATSTQCVTPTGAATNGKVVNCVVGASVAVGTYTYEIVLTDTASNPSTTTSLASGTVTVNSALASTNAPTVSTGLIDRGQTPTAATDTLPSPLGGSGTVTYTWVVSFDSGSYTAATSTQCQTPTGTASNGEVVNCVVGATVAVGTYTYQIELIDSASNPETTASGSSGIVVVNTALAAATSPTVSTASIDQGQTPIAATDTLPNPLGGSGAVTYSWLVSFNSGAYAAATSTQCATPSGTASNGKVVNCVVGASVALGSYTYEIQLRDSASSPSTTISLASGTVTVNPPLGTPGAPS